MSSLERIRNLKIAWLPWSSDPLCPTNLRRFSAFAKSSKVPYEIYNPQKKYDLIVVNQCCDLTFWSRFVSHGAKIIFETVDSYLEINRWEFRAVFRAPAKFLFGQHRYFGLSYHEQLKAMMRRADAIICSTPEQIEKYEVYNNFVFDILDFNSQQVSVQKKSYALGDVIHIAWEGMGGNAWAFSEIAPVLQRIHARKPIVLHLVTDLSYKSHNGPLSWDYALKPRLQKILGNVPFYLYEWNVDMLARICTHCDIAVLPIPKKPSIYWSKPENRLLMLWNMGLPVLTSPTPAYMRCMLAAGNDKTCTGLSDWEAKLMALIENEQLRKGSAERGRNYAQRVASDDALCSRWIRALEQIL